MDIDSKSSDEFKSVRAGLVLGFAAPLVFLGPLQRYEAVRTDNVSRAWGEVGKTLATTMERERSRLRDGGR